MLILKHTFTRPNALIDWYTPSAGAIDGVVALHASGDIISFGEILSESGLVLTKTINVVDGAALSRINADSILAANKQARSAYNNAKGITESTTTSIG
jgi:hypothetical protein